jgi:hypothetical protein
MRRNRQVIGCGVLVQHLAFEAAFIQAAIGRSP